MTGVETAFGGTAQNTNSTNSFSINSLGTISQNRKQMFGV